MESLFIDWNVSPEIIGSVRWYGLMFAVGFSVGYYIVYKMFRHEGAPEKWLSILLIWLIAGTMIGARLGHVFFYQWDYYSQHPWKILATWEGGLASHGGAIGVILAVILFSIFTSKRSPLWTLDRLVAPVALTGALIRFGNLMNSEIYGHATDLPWGFRFIVNMEQWQNGADPIYTLPSHPTQIYESLCYLALFGLLMWMYWKRNDEERPGLMLGVFLVVLFVARFLIEFIKNPQEEFEQEMTLNMGQLLSIPFILVGVFFIIRAYVLPRKTIIFPNRFADERKK